MLVGFDFCRKQERQMARHFAIVPNEQSIPVPEEGKATVDLDAVGIRQLRCWATA